MESVGKVFTPKELHDLAKERLNEDNKRIENDIKAIKDWMSKQPHLKEHGRCDDAFILMFLRGCKFSLEKTKKKIDMWHTVRTHCPEFFKDYNTKDSKTMELIRAGINVPLKGFDKHGRRVVILRGSGVDHDKFNMIDQFRVTYMINELMMKDCDDTQGQICGVVVIQDVRDASIGQLKHFSPSIGKKTMTIFQEAYPANPKAMFFLGMPGFMEGTFNLVMGFLKDKFKQRIKMLPKDNFSVLHEELGTEVLPHEYGGTNGKLQDHIDNLVTLCQKNHGWLAKQYKHKSNEKKRPGKEMLYSDLFGMEGSFRQLSVD